eukprot:SAG22_NODE_7465_length_736_cov_6.204082_2_plen_143_part_00
MDDWSFGLIKSSVCFQEKKNAPPPEKEKKKKKEYEKHPGKEVPREAIVGKKLIAFVVGDRKYSVAEDGDGEIYGLNGFKVVEQEDFVMKDKTQVKSLVDASKHSLSEAGQETIKSFLEKKKMKDPSSEEEVYNSEDDTGLWR